MARTNFPIPSEYESQLRHVPALDNRPDDEILHSASTYQPITSERNIWAFWHSGLDSMPAWCKRNIINWARLNGRGWTIRVLDQVEDSTNNVQSYLPPDLIPPVFLKKQITGPFKGQHSADLIRGGLLYTHGGIWMDVGIILFRKLDSVCWDILADSNSPYEISVMHMGGSGTGISNHFIAARKNSALIKRWHELFSYLWKDRTTCRGLLAHPLLQPVLEAGQKFHGDEGTDRFGWEHVCAPEDILDYGGHILAWQRLCMLHDTEDGFNGAEYFEQKVLLLDVVQESWKAEEIVGWKGQQLFDVLRTRLDADRESGEWKLAYRAVMTILAESSMQKVYRGKEMLKYPALGTLWDEDGNEERDHESGTFARLMRDGSVHFEQRRDLVFIENNKPHVVLRKGLYED
ncbi:capsular polysaccharide synthesis protein-domain-containing protein [Aspergillus karnatakaensis]|uniref:capsular polysaccharide synthesis protein-domain-containing protein n=1 Tax=Aspergillus karnatakaensis TaxID=1810916 RepID=UPI003CCE1BDB